MTMKVFAGGLSWNTTNESLRTNFEQFGEIEDVNIITDRETGKSRGFGFITFIDPASAKQAISEMDGKEFEGRNIKVNEATEKPRRDSRGGGKRW